MNTVGSANCACHPVNNNLPSVICHSSLSVDWRPITTAATEIGATVPCGRWKHASTYHRGWLYVHGGRSGRQPLKDLWRFRDRCGWQCLPLLDSPPPPLEGHTLMGRNHRLYLFGGTYGGYPDCPLWIVDLNTMISRQWSCGKSEVMQPGSRRHHSSVQYRAAFYIFGGVVDIRGASNDLWAFDLPTESWHLVWSPSTHSSPGPSPRFGHSACEHNNHMWVLGGYSDIRLCPSELWRWSFLIGQWCRVRYTTGPPPMAYHASACTPNQMFIFGGVGRDCDYDSLWSFSFSTMSWNTVTQSKATRPSGISHHSLLLASQFCQQMVSAPCLPRNPPITVENMLLRPLSCPEQRTANHIQSRITTPADSGFSGSRSNFSPIREEQEDLHLEDIEDCPDLFSQSSASLISSLSLGTLSLSAENSVTSEVVLPQPHSNNWSFANASLSVSSFGSAAIDLWSDEEILDEFDYEDFLFSTDNSSNSLIFYCFGAQESSIQARSLLIWEGTVCTSSR